MRKLLIIIGLFVSVALTAQVTELTHRTYGTQVRDQLNTNLTNVQDSLDALGVIADANLTNQGTLRDTVIINMTDIDSLKEGQSIVVGEVLTAYFLFYDPINNIVTYGDTVGFGGVGSGSDVFKVGAPVNDQVGVWTGNGTLEGDADLTFDGSHLTTTGNIIVGGTVDGIDIATDVGANTGKTTNATHTGDVTGATALTIANDKVLESHLKAVNSPTDEYTLTYESTTGDFEWQLNSATDAIARSMLADSTKIYNVLSHGASRDSSVALAKTTREAFQSAVDAAGLAGGGEVLVPQGDYLLDSTVTISYPGVRIIGQSSAFLKGTYVAFRNTQSYKAGFLFEIYGDEIGHGSVENMYIRLQQDTITAIKFVRPRFCDVKNVYIRNFNGLADQTTGVQIFGTGDWGGGVHVDRLRTADILYGVHMDSVSNHNMITNSWILGQAWGNVGSRGVIIGTLEDQENDTQVLFGNDFEGWNVAIETQAPYPRITDNRFESCDTAIYISQLYNSTIIKGNVYASIGEEIVYAIPASVDKYLTRLDPNRPLYLSGGGSTTGANVVMGNSSSTHGPKLEIFSQHISNTNPLLSLTTHGSSSHTNVFGETVTTVEGILSSTETLKVGTSTSNPFNLYTNDIERINIAAGGDVTFSGDIYPNAGTQAVNPNIIQDSLRRFNVTSSYGGITGAISGDGLSDTAGINSAIRAAAALPTWGDFPTVIIPYGRYNLDGPIIPMSFVNIEIEDYAVFYLTSGYTGTAILFDDDVAHTQITINGGYFIEESPRSRLWSGIKVDKQTSPSFYFSFSNISNMQFQYPGVGIDGNVNNGGWFNGVTFENIIFGDFVKGIELIDGGSSNAQIRGNVFDKITFQAAAATTHGYIEADGEVNMLSNSVFWDFPEWTDPVIGAPDYSGCLIEPSVSTLESEFDNNSYERKVAVESILYSQDGVADTIAYIPDLAIVWDVQVRISTTFNDSGTDLLVVGYGADNDFYLNDEDVSGGSGFVSVSQLTAPVLMWTNNYITATYTGQNSDATAGKATIWIQYSIK